MGNLTIGLPSEEQPVTEFVVQLPQEFEVKAARSPTGGSQWTLVQEDRTLRYTGGTLRPFSCLYLQVAGVVARQGTVVIPLTVTHADGTVRQYDRADSGDQYAAQVVYVGIDPPGGPVQADRPPGSNRRQPDAVPVPIPAIAAAAAAAGGAWWLVSRIRRRPQQ